MASSDPQTGKEIWAAVIGCLIGLLIVMYFQDSFRFDLFPSWAQTKTANQGNERK